MVKINKNFEAQTFEQCVMCYILAGGKFCENDFKRFTGFGAENSAAKIRWQADKKGQSEFIKAKQRQYIKADGKKWDLFILESNADFNNPFSVDEMDGINTIADILSNYSREEMAGYLQAQAPTELNEMGYPAAWDQQTNTLPENVFLLDYSEKSFVIHGATFFIKDTLKKFGGRFNPFLTHPETFENIKGWIFPASKKQIVLQCLSIA